MELVKLVKSLSTLGNKIMKFNIFNRTTRQPENDIFADNPAMLRQIYAMNGEEIEIVSATDDNPVNHLGVVTVPDEIKKMAAAIPDDGLGIKPVQPLHVPLTPIPYNPVAEPNQIQPIMPVQLTTPYVVTDIKNIQEKYFTDNGTEYKINNDGSFKKSWVDVDPKLFRVINTENNKEIKLTNKKIQTLDWVKIS